MIQAMILAAGRGQRLQPLTDKQPKPLLQAGRHRLIEYTIQNLHAAGFNELIINTAWLGEQIIDYLGNGQNYGVNIRYSPETEGALETAGGIVNALPLIQSDRFLVVNADIYCDYPLHQLRDIKSPAHIILTNNPAHHPAGDYILQKNGQLGFAAKGDVGFTFSGISVYNKSFFAAYKPGVLPLRNVFRDAIERSMLSGEFYDGNLD